MSSIQSWREIILCAVSLEPVYTAAFNRSFSTQKHHDTVKYCLYTDTSMSLQAEPCYNKIQGYTVARCCQTPSELHLKYLVVFCPPDMIKLELQIESPTAKVHMLLAYCSCYTDWRGLFIKIKANQEEKSHSSLFLLLFCFHPSLSPCHLQLLILKCKSKEPWSFGDAISTVLSSPAVTHAILDAFSSHCLSLTNLCASDQELRPLLHPSLFA